MIGLCKRHWLIAFAAFWVASTASLCRADDAKKSSSSTNDSAVLAGPGKDGASTLVSKGAADEKSKSVSTVAHPDPHADHKDGGHASGGHHETTLWGKPREARFMTLSLNLRKGTEFLSVEWPLFIWTLILFIGLFWVMKTFIWKPTLEAFHKREHAIEESFKQAELAKAEADRLLHQYDDWLTTAHTKSKELLEQARQTAGAEAEALLAKAKAESEASLEKAKLELESARTEALAQVRESAAELSASLASRVTGKTFEAADARAMQGGRT